MSTLTTQPTVVPTAAVNPFTRRTFMKTSALTVGAVTLLSKGTALAVAGAGSSSGTATNPGEVTLYGLECRADPLSGKRNDAEAAELIALGPQPGQFSSYDDTPLDPAWLGNTANSCLFLNLIAVGPKEGDRSTSFSIQSKLWGYLKIGGKIICYVTSFTEEEISDVSNPAEKVFRDFPHDRILHVEKREVSVSCDLLSGKITYSPPSGICSDDDQVGTAIGQTDASMTAFAAFKARAELKHDFRSAFTADGGLSASAKGLIGISVNVKADLNSLKAFAVTPTSLKWEIWRIATTWKNGVKIRVEEMQLSQTPATQDDQTEP